MSAPDPLKTAALFTAAIGAVAKAHLKPPLAKMAPKGQAEGDSFTIEKRSGRRGFAPARFTIRAVGGR